MNRPAKYHISDPVLPWVYSAKEAEAYFDHIEAELSACKERVRELIEAGKALWPHIHEEAMEGESDFERAWMHFESVLFFDKQALEAQEQTKEVAR